MHRTNPQILLVNQVYGSKNRLRQTLVKNVQPVVVKIVFDFREKQSPTEFYENSEWKFSMQ